MEFGSQEWFEELRETTLKRIKAQNLSDDKKLRKRFKKEFKVPDEFMDLAIKIWWDGKED